MLFITFVVVVVLEGGAGGWASLDTINAMPMPFTSEIHDEGNLHSFASPTCVVVPKSGRYSIVAAVVFELDETGERELYVTATSPGGEARRVSELLSVVPDQTKQMRLAVFTVATLQDRDCVELYAGAPGHHDSTGKLFALVVAFAFWEN